MIRRPFYLFASIVVLMFTAFAPGLTLADADSRLDETREKLARAIGDNNRPEEETQRDANRLPMETLMFFGVRDNMKVLDILPANYYTRILAPVLKERGELHLAVGTGYLADNLLKEESYQHVKVQSAETSIHRPEGLRYYDLGALDLGVKNLDMVTSFRAYHLFDDGDRQALNQAVHGALKPGGIYAVIDHTRRHGEPETEANRRRFDPVKAIKEIEDAGFDFVDYSPMHYREADDLTLEVGDESVTGQTDRWALKFVKQ